MLFLVAGSGITPVMAMLRTLDRRGTMPDVVVEVTPVDGLVVPATDRELVPENGRPRL